MPQIPHNMKFVQNIRNHIPSFNCAIFKIPLSGEQRLKLHLLGENLINEFTQYSNKVNCIETCYNVQGIAVQKIISVIKYDSICTFCIIAQEHSGYQNIPLNVILYGSYNIQTVSSEEQGLLDPFVLICIVTILSFFIL